MPVKIRKIEGGYKVSTPGGVKAKKTTKKKAIAQKIIIEKSHNEQLAERMTS